MTPKLPQITTCPYARTLLVNVETSVEHIFPHSIGGSADFAVHASEVANSSLGTAIDAPFVDSDLVVACRQRHEIKSRSGIPQLKVRGKVTETGDEVEYTFGTEESEQIRFINPVEPIENVFQIRASDSDQERLVQAVIDQNRKKGKSVEAISRTRMESPGLHLEVTFDLTDVKLGMLKIAYLCAFRFLGDAWLDDPIAQKMHQVLVSSEPREAVQGCEIHGQAFNCANVVGPLFPSLSQAEHAVAVCRFNSGHPFIALGLFGGEFLNISTRLSERSTFGLQETDGFVAIVDAKQRRTEVRSFMDHANTLCDDGLWT